MAAASGLMRLRRNVIIWKVSIIIIIDSNILGENSKFRIIVNEGINCVPLPPVPSPRSGTE